MCMSPWQDKRNTCKSRDPQKLFNHNTNYIKGILTRQRKLAELNSKSEG